LELFDPWQTCYSVSLMNVDVLPYW
jgi:hypothetical protein